MKTQEKDQLILESVNCLRELQKETVNLNFNHNSGVYFEINKEIVSCIKFLDECVIYSLYNEGKCKICMQLCLQQLEILNSYCKLHVCYFPSGEEVNKRLEKLWDSSYNKIKQLYVVCFKEEWKRVH